jgi:hypothetical protein
MKRGLLLLTILLLLIPLLSGQKVDSIKVEQAGDFIKIRYKILNSNQNQFFKVTISCSINGGLKSELRTLLGDFGENIPGGKTEYTAIWDVLKDVDEVNSADFSVRAELTRGDASDLSDKIKIKKEPKKNFNIMPVLQLPGPGFGIRMGYMGKVGISMQYTMTSGQKILLPGAVYDGGNPTLKRYSVDFTARLINIKSFQMHLLIGESMGEAIGWEGPKVKVIPGVEGGLAFCPGNAIITITGCRLLFNLVNQPTDPIYTKQTFLTLGAGFRF